MSKLLIVVVFFAFFSGSWAYTREEIAYQVKQNKEKVSFPFSATIRQKVSIQGNMVTDSGRILFCPPDCYKIELFRTNTKMFITGDTLWQVSPDGSVTRSVGNNDGVMGGMGTGFSPGSQNGFNLPEDFTIIEQIPGKQVVVECLSKVQSDQFKIRIVYDTKKWLPRNLKISGGPQGETETGFVYTELNGIQMVKEMNMVLGAMGYIRIDYSDYKVLQKCLRSSFRPE
jgi:outer membrane lipoprotein-sorting protein